MDNSGVTRRGDAEVCRLDPVIPGRIEDVNYGAQLRT
jgi:hypothetical protein